MKVYFDDIINELTLQELQETLCNNKYILNEENVKFDTQYVGRYNKEQVDKFVMGAVDQTKRLFGTIWGNVKSWFNGINMSEKFNQLKEYLSSTKGLTTAGLAGAGLLGAYYLYKKFLSKKKLDSNDARYAARIQQLQPNQLPPNIANQQIG